jgi:hypothetical protein
LVEEVMRRRTIQAFRVMRLVKDKLRYIKNAMIVCPYRRLFRHVREGSMRCWKPAPLDVFTTAPAPMAEKGEEGGGLEKVYVRPQGANFLVSRYALYSELVAKTASNDKPTIS